MPVVASIDTTQQIVTFVFSGETSFSEWQAVMDAEYGMSRMAELLADGTGVRVRAFHEPESALVWLTDERHG